MLPSRKLFLSLRPYIFSFLVLSFCSWPSWAVPSGATIQPGAGWSGATAQPGPVGSGPGSDRRPIAHWDAVPYVTVRPGTIFNVGVLAYHINDINRVEFSLNNGPWLAIDSKSMNPQTKAEEYWVRVDPTVFTQSGRYEMRVRVYPNAGVVRVLQTLSGSSNESTKDSSLYINVETTLGALPHTIRYATANGNDANPCSQGLPCQTLSRAIASAVVGNSLDGAEIRLGEGYWHNGPLSTLGNYDIPNQWLTITAAPGANSANVKIRGWRTSQQMSNYKLVHYQNVTMVDQMVANDFGQPMDYIWLDNVRIIDESPTAMQVANNCWGPTGQFTGVWITDVYQDQLCYAPSGTLVRNVYVDRSAAGYSADATPTLVNIEQNLIYGSGYYGIDYHGDIVHFWGSGPGGLAAAPGSQDRIMYGLIVKPTGNPVNARGIAATNEDQLDIAIVNTDLSPSTPFLFPLSMCGALAGVNPATQTPIPERYINHYLVLNSRFVGGGTWCGESGMQPEWTSHMENIRIENTIFENGTPEKMMGPINATKIRYNPGIGSSNTGLTLISPNGTVTKTPNQVTFGSGAQVNLQATPLPGYQFDHWVGDLTGTSPVGTITLPTSGAARVKYAHAYFVPNQISNPVNQPPQVNTGPNQSIVWPAASVNLSGQVSDDGLPNPPGAVTILWSKSSGPGTVTFGNAASATTTAQFSQQGVYVLRLTANDSQLESIGEMQVTVYPPGVTNEAPHVDAGNDQEIDGSADAQLNATVSDDGLPNPPGRLTLTWSLVNGPGDVVFSNGSAATTQAHFSQAGTYTLQLRADDSLLSTVDLLNVIVNASSVGASEINETKILPCMDLHDEAARLHPCLRYQLARGSHVQISIYSRDGKLVRILIDEDQPSGLYTIPWDRRDKFGNTVGSGIVNVVLKADGKTLTTKLPIIK